MQPYFEEGFLKGWLLLTKNRKISKMYRKKVLFLRRFRRIRIRRFCPPSILTHTGPGEIDGILRTNIIVVNSILFSLFFIK